MSEPLIGCLIIRDYSARVFTYSSDAPAPVVTVTSGEVVACTAEARQAGIEPGMSTEHARVLLPNVRIRPRDVALETAVWEDVLEQTHAITPFIENVAPGILYFKAGREEVERLTVRLHASAGLAPHRSYALLAAAVAAPDRSLEVLPMSVRRFMDRFRIGDLARLGFSPNCLRRLQLFGFGSLGALLRRRRRPITRRHLRVQFGTEGERLYDLLHPTDAPTMGFFAPAPTVNAAFEFEDPASHPFELLPVLEHLVRQAAGGLGGLLCQRVRVNLIVRGRAAAAFASRILPEPTGDGRRLLLAGKTLLQDALRSWMEVDTLTLELGALSQAKPRQQSLFRERPSL